MTVKIEIASNMIRVIDRKGELPQATKTSLRLQGFSREFDEFIAQHVDSEALALSLDLLRDAEVQIELDKETEKIIGQAEKAKEYLQRSRKLGGSIKRGEIDQSKIRDFLQFLERDLNRPLLSHQIKAALHLVTVAHGANFSVPGAGKTSVVLAAYEFLRRSNKVNSLFVVGPRSCFVPWQTEFKITLGRQPRLVALAGGRVQERRQKYYPKSGDEAELYLTTYQTLTNDHKQVQHLIQSRTNRVFFVIDEAHYMKQNEGVWAGAVAETSKYAYKRCVLTGTPFPKTYADGINLFEVLYPNSEIFGRNTKSFIRNASDSGNHQSARTKLEPKIDSLYYRVRKKDLNLSKPVFMRPIQIVMNPIERKLYECVEKRIGRLIERTTDQDLETIIQLQKARQIRRRQATSYAALLLTAIPGYSEELVDPQEELLNERIQNYDKYEKPAKVERLLQELLQLHHQGKKVVVWANFVGTLHKIKEECNEICLKSKVVYGGTPTEDGMDEESRETIIEKFKEKDSGLDILIANPAACAESVSLHKTCSNAIYYDLSYNCAEYLQSLDRIHRVGGSEKTASYYRFLQYVDTFEHQILKNLTEKAGRMANVIDRDFPLAMCELTKFGIDGNDQLG